MRRMQIITEIFSTIPGTTSAYAENTLSFSLLHLHQGNYLRVRGEYQIKGLAMGTVAGTTSACAENTACPAT